MAKKSRGKNYLIFMVPSIVPLLLTVVAPMVYSFVLSFTNADLKYRGIGDFVGISNYIHVLSDTYFRGSIATTFIFSFVVVAIEFVIGFGIALLLNTNIKGKNIFFSIIIVPMMITPIAVGLCWRLLLHNTLGIVNWLLRTIGLGGHAWLGDTKTALATVMFIDIWQQVSYMVLVLLAGLVSLPTEPYEAARIDGASNRQCFRYLTLPMMAPTFSVALLLRLITAFKTYDLIYVLTKGGPGTSTEVISYHIYRQAFTYLKTGNASAMSFILVIILLPLAYLAIRLLWRRRD